jgi:hypothetical protein
LTSSHPRLRGRGVSLPTRRTSFSSLVKTPRSYVRSVASIEIETLTWSSRPSEPMNPTRQVKRPQHFGFEFALSRICGWVWITVVTLVPNATHNHRITFGLGGVGSGDLVGVTLFHKAELASLHPLERHGRETTRASRPRK